MKVRIEADGRPQGTRIISETGRDLSASVAAVEFRHRAGEAPRVEVVLLLPSAVIEGEAAFFALDGRPVRRIEFADGTVELFTVPDPLPGARTP